MVQKQRIPAFKGGKEHYSSAPSLFHVQKGLSDERPDLSVQSANFYKLTNECVRIWL